MLANGNEFFGIDPNRIYFKEDIAKLWRYDYAPEQYDNLSPAQREPLVKTEDDKLRKWFNRNFLSKGLRTFRCAGRVAVHGKHLADWIWHNSGRSDE